MAKPPPIYDLVLLLSLSAEAEVRAKVVADVEAAITNAGGTVEVKQEWGTRPMTFEIRHEGEAEYHMIQFSGPTSLLESLSHTLHIEDSVLRFRIIKQIPGTPPVQDSPPPVLAAVAGGASPLAEDES